MGWSDRIDGCAGARLGEAPITIRVIQDLIVMVKRELKRVCVLTAEIAMYTSRVKEVSWTGFSSGS